jgi:modulator of FtsH protease
MSTAAYGDAYGGAAVRETGTLFGQTMALVAATAGTFALGCYLGRNLSYGWGWVAYIASFACLIGMNFAVKGAGIAGPIGLLLLFGLFIGIGTAPVIAYYAEADPQAVWQAGAATALFMLVLGSIGYSTKRDLSALGRISFFALIGLLIFGIVLIFVNLPNGTLIYAILGLVVFAGLTAFDFQRLRRTKEDAAAPFLAASIFLDALNVFLFFLRIFARNN